ncbi:hypothetical protein [Paenibacillus sacheonensis]|uniref:Uncharacterized protein n=1 Tax=Paenibacillus sacheonensis TaxID=742054 RepID=A0A7X5BXU1_9BACL|nr:hypothetical protein [Paenibacillus sacheonensis]MBM7565909.1 hypothetical protein [Paenibacillus sacheonensis]NBC68776.1 hypothetical protein [Paenibacillus sacheonensis]
MRNIGYRTGITRGIAILAIASFTLAGCSEASQLKAFASKQVHSVMDPPKDEIPQPLVVANGKRLATLQSTYCWGNLGCADYIGGYGTARKYAPSTIVKAGAVIDVSFAYKPAPAQVEVTQYRNDRESASIQLTNGHYLAPQKPGLYYYGISAYWKSADGKYADGDTSVIYAIQVI